MAAKTTKRSPAANNEDITLAKLCAEFAADKKANNPVILDLSELNGPASYFLICSGESEPQLKAIAESITGGLRDKHGIRAISAEGRNTSQWIVLDYGSLLVHIMHEEKRAFYNLEKLWRDAKTVSF
ncbi:MAG: ribosome silencing factor [Verrucomicrobiales bacterium]|jgi:ribosome-associated protein|nr:ribosome silencing factor [Verrucomicrobiales bacterium]